MHMLYELKDKLIKELEDYSENGKYSKDDIEAIKYLASAVDHLCNIMEDEEYSGAYEGSSYENMGGGMSNARGSRGGQSYRGANQYGSYRRGANQYGSYARRGMGYSREDGYSRNESMISELYELMENAPDEKTKKEFERFIKKVEMM